MKVYYELEKNNTEGARKAVSMIVGRDTEKLDEKGIIKATVETVAENTSDGVIAPMFYMALGGALGGVLYKAVNTMDSMVGYKNDKYIYFGRIPARADDIANYIPSRISAYIMILSAYITGFDAKNAYRIYKRDRYKHASPNSAHTEAVCAGALGIKLAGNAFYFGKLCEKEYIGDEINEIKPKNIKQANKLMYMTAFISMIMIFAVKTAIILRCFL
jgi:adenosylcobinamide-phosphate synthase